MARATRLPKCELHVGIEKTGSTSLQRFLGMNRQHLLDAGMLVPECLSPPASGGNLNHVFLTTANFDDPEGPNDLQQSFNLFSTADIRRHRAEIAAALRSEIDDCRTLVDRLVLSNEHIHSRWRKSADLATLKNFLGDFCEDIRVIVYLRPQHEVSQSLAATALRSGAIEFRPIPEFNTDNGYDDILGVDYNYFDYDRFLAALAETFGESAIVPRLYGSDSVNGDIIDDFFSVLGLDVGAMERPVRENGNIDGAAIGLLLELNRFMAEHPAYEAVRKAAIAYVNSRPRGFGAQPSRAAAEAFTARFRASNERACARWFPGRQSLFDVRLDLLPDKAESVSTTASGRSLEFFDLIKFLTEKHLSGGLAVTARPVMRFDGVVESLNQSRITGWACYNLPDKKVVPRIVLRFESLGAFEPTTIAKRDDGLTGFIFDLPPHFRDLAWGNFLAEFLGVFAEYDAPAGVERWRIPLYKSVLSGFDPKNATVLLADRLQQYKLAPRPEGRIAALTIAYNEFVMLPLWARYYEKYFGAENLFVIDQSSDGIYDNILPRGVNIIRIPRDAFDNWLIVRLVATMQRFLLESYDSVLYTDSDEFVCASPDVLAGRDLRQFLLELKAPVGITRGYDLHHDMPREPPYDASRPVLDQRRVIRYQPMMDKPVVSRLPLNWIPGFHSAREGGMPVPGLYMLHLRWFDLDQALNKGARYRASKWSQIDIERRLAEYQRDEDAQVIDRFKAWANSFARLDADAVFDARAELTVVPDWMRQEISI